MPHDIKSSWKVLVIGAGVAGLAAIQPLGGFCDDTLRYSGCFFPTKQIGVLLKNEDPWEMKQNRSVNDVNVFALMDLCEEIGRILVTSFFQVTSLIPQMDVRIRPWQDHWKHPTWDMLFALNP